MLAVICLPIILLSVQAGAQPTADENTSCGSPTTLQGVANLITITASNQQETVTKIKDEIKDVKNLLASNPTAFNAAHASKQVLVSALLCEYISFQVLINLTQNDVFVINLDKDN